MSPVVHPWKVGDIVLYRPTYRRVWRVGEIKSLGKMYASITGDGDRVHIPRIKARLRSRDWARTVIAQMEEIDAARARAEAAAAVAQREARAKVLACYCDEFLP